MERKGDLVGGRSERGGGTEAGGLSGVIKQNRLDGGERLNLGLEEEMEKRTELVKKMRVEIANEDAMANPERADLALSGGLVTFANGGGVSVDGGGVASNDGGADEAGNVSPIFFRGLETDLIAKVDQFLENDKSDESDDNNDNNDDKGKLFYRFFFRGSSFP